jgi:hypothetical protein
MDEIVMPPAVEGMVDRPVAVERKRKSDDELPCKVVTGKRIRKAVRDPQGNEYVMQMNGHRGGWA